MTHLSGVAHLQIEITTHCNASCPGCARNHQGGETKSILPLQNMSLDTWKTLIAKNNVNFYEINFNGSFGDALMHPDIIKMLEHLLTVSTDYDISIATNGSMRNTDFFHELAKVLKQFRFHEVVFAIDGLENTHDIYRRKTKFTQIIQNLRSFNQSGGLSVWNMTVFDHNLSQIDQCKSMAGQLGCSRFQIRRSYAPSITAKKYLHYPAQKINSPEYHLVDALIDQHNQDLKNKMNIGEQNHKCMAHRHTKSVSICPWVQGKLIQVDVFGNIWPCCYVHDAQIDSLEHPEWDFNILQQKFGNNFNNIHHHDGIQQIIDGKFFRQYVTKQWKYQASPLCQECMGK